MSALEIPVEPGQLSTGLSHQMIAAMAAAAADAGYAELVAPVRPNEKHTRPGLPMVDYVRLTR